ncbi:adhesion G-protein coupled receptor G7 [Esox lucius]|uniref:adhesion G-protein coupled receptor G7 n=1 Tax=Esox lucius TaxID=8010 RepID=UPI001476E25A|nr:adhesion G-protein coupled receptor G7 [Esox lucius]
MIKLWIIAILTTVSSLQTGLNSRSDGTTNYSLDGSTTNHPDGTTINLPNGTTTNPPDATTTNPPDRTTTNPPDGATTNPPDATTTNPLDATTTNPPDAATTNPPDATTTNPPDRTTTNPPDRTTTNPPDHTTTNPTDGTTTNPPDATTTNPPDAATTNPPDATTTNPPDRTTTNPPDRTTTNPPDHTTTNPTDSTTTSPPDSTTTVPLAGNTTKLPNDTTSNPSDSTTTEPLASNTTKLPNDTVTESAAGNTTNLPDDTTTEALASSTTKLPNYTTTDPPDHPTTNLPDEATTGPPAGNTTKLPNDTTIDPPDNNTTNLPDDTTTEPLASSTTKLPNDTTTDPPDSNTTNLPDDTTTEPAAGKTTKLPNYTTTDPPDSNTTNLPDDTTTEPTASSTTKLPNDTTTDPPVSNTTNLPDDTTTEPFASSTTKLPNDTTTDPPDSNTTNLPDDTTTEPAAGNTTKLPIDTTTDSPDDTTAFTTTPSTTSTSPTKTTSIEYPTTHATPPNLSTKTASPTTPTTTPTSTTNTTALPSTSSTTIPPLVCINGGELQSGVCICPDEWTGKTCSDPNFCNSSKFDGFIFPKTTIGWFGYSTETCPKNTNNADLSKASAICLNDNGTPKFGPYQVLNCDLTLSDIKENINSGLDNLFNLASSTQILTSKPEKLSADNINTAAEITNKLLNSTQNITQDIAVAAITTISQLLNANGKSTPDNTAVNSLTITLEQFSLKQQSNVSLIVQPNLVVQSAQVPQDTVGIKFTAFTGKSGKFVANRIQLNTNSSELIVGNEGSTDVQMVIKFKPVLSREDANHSVGFVLYQNDHFFKSRAFQTSLGTSRRILSANFGNMSGLDVEMSFKPTTVPNASLHDFACVSWNYTLDDWSTYGCSKVNHSNDGLQCLCNHTTNFAVLMTFRRDFQSPPLLDWITILGCSMSVIGLGLTIIFQIVTRKLRKTLPTLLLVNLCTSLLMSTLLFMLAVENSNQQPKKPKINTNNIPPSDMHTEPDTGPCTAVTALLQFFQLGTFTWSTLYATHIFLMVRNVLAFTPQHFTAYTMVIGWGLPAVIVVLTLGISYRQDNPLGYRQEEFCWLAALDFYRNFDFKQPLFWGFLIPVACMLIINTLMLMHFAVATSKSDPHLNSTRHDSMKKKILRSFSLAVVLSLSWILGYLLLINHDKTTFTVLNIFFCILTTTQGFQIFILFTARTAIVKKKISSALKAVSSVDISLCTKKYSLRQGKQTEKVESYTELDNGLSTALSTSSSLQTVSST